MLGTILVLAALDALSYDLVFVLWLIGFLIVVELTAPAVVTPTWRRRLRWPILISLAIFGLIVLRRIYEILEGVIF